MMNMYKWCNTLAFWIVYGFGFTRCAQWSSPWHAEADERGGAA